MKCISNTYNIYLTDKGSLLFYDTFKEGELDKPKIAVNEVPQLLFEMVELLAKKTPHEISVLWYAYLSYDGFKILDEISYFMLDK